MSEFTPTKTLSDFYRITGFRLHCVIKTRKYFQAIESHLNRIKNQSTPDFLLLIDPQKNEIELQYHKKTISHFSNKDLSPALEKIKLFFQSTHRDFALQLSIKELLGLFK